LGGNISKIMRSVPARFPGSVLSQSKALKIIVYYQILLS
jgi:hypothetical protein